MASVQQGEKLLFEKFWRGTFKAVATPRPGSCIVASITASHRNLPSGALISCLSYPRKDRTLQPVGGPGAPETVKTNGCVKESDQTRLERHRTRSPSCEAESRLKLTPSTKGKKKKKKSDRKKRRRSRSYSPSPVKKKKKKSSKKHKRHRSSSKKGRHSSSSPKSKSKEERKHRKQHSRGRPRKSHRHRRRRARSERSHSRSSSCESRHIVKTQNKCHKTKRRHHSHRSKVTVQPAVFLVKNQFACSPTQISETGSATSLKDIISSSGTASGLFIGADSGLGIQPSPKGQPKEYDSGTEACSPQSMQESASVSKVIEKESPGHGDFNNSVPSPKDKMVHSDNISDSGNSSASSFSQSKVTTVDNHCTDSGSHDERGVLSPCLGCLEEKKHVLPLSPARSLPRKERTRSRSYGSSRRSSSRSSSRSSRHRSRSPTWSRSRSGSSRKRSYSRSSSHSSRSSRRSKGSRSSRPRRSPSYSRYSLSRDRQRDHRYGSSDKDSNKDRQNKRRRSYSPMRKRRRDSPSHLEARRITSARKRPIPYYRPSPSSSSSSESSYTSCHDRWVRSRSRATTRSSRSWSSSSSVGSRSRSRSHARSREWSDRSSRSRSYDSDRSYHSRRG